MLALWMLFVRETWMINSNLLQHRVGIGSLAHVTRVQYVHLQIRSGLSVHGSYHHTLQAVTSSGTQNLFTRNTYGEAAALGNFIAERAGWQFDG